MAIEIQPTDPATPKIPQISIGMPVYNGEPYIREALDSLLAQTFTDFELIISDNASTDGTEAICRKYAASDARIQYVRQTKNQGPMSNFQFVLHEAVGEYFIWAAADDSQDRRLLELLVQVFRKDSRIVLVAADVENIDGNNNVVRRDCLEQIRLELATKNANKNRRIFFRNPTTNVFFSIYGLYKRRALVNLDFSYLRKAKYAAGSEIPLLSQMALVGLIVSLPKPLKIYRRHADSVYHKEQTRWSSIQLFSNRVNISCLLFLIAARSHLTFAEKLNLLIVVFFDFVMIPARVLRSALGKLILSQRTL